MKQLTLFAAALLASLCLAAPEAPKAEPAAPAIQTTGATVGTWTMDYDAALALAKKDNKPVFLCFTGSDWCRWCKLMDRVVFSEPTWQNYAKENIILVWLDFPRNSALVPAEVATKNKDLMAKYGVRGFPTYVVLDPAGEELGRLGADQRSNPASFIKQLEAVLVLQKIDTLLSAEDLAAYKALKEEKKAATAEFEAWNAEAMKKHEAFMQRDMKLAEQISGYVNKAAEAARAQKK